MTKKEKSRNSIISGVVPDEKKLNIKSLKNNWAALGLQVEEQIEKYKLTQSKHYCQPQIIHSIVSKIIVKELIKNLPKEEK